LNVGPLARPRARFSPARADATRRGDENDGSKAPAVDRREKRVGEGRA